VRVVCGGASAELAVEIERARLIADEPEARHPLSRLFFLDLLGQEPLSSVISANAFDLNASSYRSLICR
jgi:hypothetical protein